MARLAHWICFFPLALFAAPVGNSAFPAVIQEGIFVPADSWVTYRAGYEGDFIADGRLNQVDQGSGRVDTFEQMTQSGTFTIDILDRIDLYGVFGSSSIDSDWRFENSTSELMTRIHLNTQSALFWGCGTRITLLEWGRSRLGFGGRFNSSHSHPATVTANGVDESSSGAQVRWREWQVNADLSYKISFLIPYLGVKYSNALTELKGFSFPISSSLTGSNTFKNRLPVGIYLGCTVSSGKYFFLNLEGRVIDEEAVSIAADFRF